MKSVRKKSQVKKTVAIVGSGASGVSCLIQLVLKHIVNRCSSRLSIILYEKKDEFGTGLAYGTGQEGHLLNTKAGIMGIMPYERLHFVNWMHQNKKSIKKEFPQVSIHPDAYPPRMLYGAYVQEMLECYLRLAKRNDIEVVKKKVEVTDVSTIAAHKIQIYKKNGQPDKVDYMILATGTPLSTAFRELGTLENFLSSPWPSKSILQKVNRKDAVVAVVGSSLTAIDAFITLTENGHRGPITFFSLKGLLPRVQEATEIPFERKVLTFSNIRKLIREKRRALRVKDLIRLFRAEVEGALAKKVDWSAEERADKNHLKLLEEDIQQAMSGTCLFQQILYSLREESYSIWRLLPADQKSLFVKWVKPYFDINRHAIPMENAIKLRNALKTGQLSVIGNSDDIQWDGQQFLLTTDDGKTFKADFVINASGPAVSVKKMDDQVLLQNMLKKKYIREYDAGGILAELNTMQVLSDNGRDLPIYAIGHLLAGLQHEVNSLWFNVEQADRLTDDLIQKMY